MDASDSEQATAQRAAPRSSRSHALYVWVTILAGLLVLYTLAGFLLVPVLARRALEANVRRLPGVQLHIDALSFNPFTLQAQVRGFLLRDAAQAPLAGFGQFIVAISPASLWHSGYALRRIELQDPMLNVHIDRQGRLNLLALQAPEAPHAAGAGDASSKPPEASGLPALRIDLLRIGGGRVQYADDSRTTPFATTLTPINFALTDFRTAGSGNGRFALAAHASSGEALQVSGTLALQPLASDGQFSLQGVQASTVMAYLGNALPVVLRAGVGGLAGSYQFVGAGGDTLRARLSEVQLNDLAIADRGSANGTPWLSVPHLMLNDASIELPERQIRIASLALRGVQASIGIDPDGTLSVAHLLAPAPAASPGTAATTPGIGGGASAGSTAGNPASSPGWSIGLAQLTLDEARLSLADHSVTPAVALEVGPLHLAAQGYSTDGNAPVSFDFRSGIGREGSLASHGSLRLAPFSGSLSLDLQRFDLTALQPYLDQRLAVSLYRGTLDVQGTAQMTPPGSANGSPSLSINGQINLQDFATRDRLSNVDLLTGRAVQLMGIHFQQSPDALQIGTLRVQGLYGRVVIGSDGSLNLTKLLRAPDAGSAAGAAGAHASADSPASPAKSPAPAPVTVSATAGLATAPASASMPIRIGRVQFLGSTANFTDRSVQPNFSAAIEGLHGSIVGLSSDPSSRAQVQLMGTVNRYAPVSIEGKINVLSAQTFTDLALSFDNIDLPLFNPYSGKFAGYSIAQGKLTTQMHYHVENRQLNATHHIVIDQLEFGPATDSKQAVPLPIKLAAALLKDRHGVITLDLPVGGSLSDPTFRIGPIVWKVFVGLVRHIVTAPFSWLGSLMGGDGSQLAYVDFVPGSAALDDASAHKLAQLAQALAQRPQLRLDVPLHTEGVADDHAIERQGLDAAVAETLTRLASAGTEGTGGAGQTARARRAKKAAASGAEAQPPSRIAALGALYGQQFHAAPQYPADAVSDEQRTAWLEQQLLPQFAPARQQRDALGLARANAAQMSVLAGGQVTATRVFFTQRASGDGPTDVVRMELQLQ